MRPRLGIMQGRLSAPEDGRIQAFPASSWAGEFRTAAAAGLSHIEWIYEVYKADENPLSSRDGRARIQQCIGETQVTVKSLCADYFMDQPLVRCSESELSCRIDVLGQLLIWAQDLSVERIVLPFVDASAILTTSDQRRVVDILNRILPAAEDAGIEIHLETDLNPQQFASLLERVPHRALKVNYDTGNSASLGYDPEEELTWYGSRIGSVHIKDRVGKGGTVPLGTGHVDFERFFLALKRSGYSRDFILQVARGEPGTELSWAIQNREFVESQLKRCEWQCN